MNFNIRAESNFVFHNIYCALPKDMIDIEVSIRIVDGIHTWRRDRTSQTALYSSWNRQVNLFPCLRKKIAEYQEEKKSFHPITHIRETNFGKKRSRRFQKSRKYRKFDMGCFTSTTAASMCPTTTATTTTANLSAPSSPPSILDVPKPPAAQKPSKTWAKPYPTAVLLSSPVHLD